MKLLLGIDDTDNKESRGTGFLSRQLASFLEDKGYGKVLGITRHQLLVHPDIQYTSQNSSACLEIVTSRRKEVRQKSAGFIEENAAPGSDAGLVVATYDEISQNIVKWGYRAKMEVLTLHEALETAGADNLYIEGFTGSKIGQIGALAAVGLRRGGNDGRFIWIGGKRELRDFPSGIFNAAEIKSSLNIWKIKTKEGKFVSDESMIYCSDWIRPVLLNNKSVLLVEEVKKGHYGYQTANKEYIRKNS